jgi:hypothetical protein
LVRHRETEYTRSIVSFALSTPVVVVEFDASLDGVNASEKALGVSLQHLTRFNARFIPLLRAYDVL